MKYHLNSAASHNDLVGNSAQPSKSMQSAGLAFAVAAAAFTESKRVSAVLKSLGVIWLTTLFRLTL